MTRNTFLGPSGEDTAPLQPVLTELARHFYLGLIIKLDFLQTGYFGFVFVSLLVLQALTL